MSVSKTSVFGTRLGFYLVAIGSAFGLGNLWRFPYVVAENGGGAFVLLYLFLVFVIGIPFLIAELALGKISRTGILSATRKLSGHRYRVNEIRENPIVASGFDLFLLRLAGWLSMFITIVVLAYYAVISGWVLHFFAQLLTAAMTSGQFNSDGALKVLFENGWLQLLLTSLHLVTVSVIVAKDLEYGLEKWVGYFMPVFVILLLGLAFQSLQLDSATEAMRFLFYPQFSKLSLVSLGQAVGHVLFTLSVGFASMVTFGSYLREGTYLPMAGFRVAILDSAISLWAGVLIFPLVIMSAGMISSPQLLFQTVPRLLVELPGGLWFGVAFFLCLYLASLGASIGLFESVVANWREARRMPRNKGSFAVALLCFLIAVIPALSSSVLSDFRLTGRNLLEFLDAALINWFLPVSALLISQIVAWKLKQSAILEEFLDPDWPGSAKLFIHWRFMLRYVAAPILVVALGLQLASVL